ncbi:hypothetical protein BCR35DRAFT_303268 [Leucosporidium creatinivorum]|uniref:Uncharacterized protein n=1 Tax=Leucosporidium creatinivorum TaxID=106004 RepID=A0A1Y2FJR3_9BASI|nr:hypothetical protein BCR35DRAFT_303268 [Leucosporidium creatinivorum]
MQSNLVLRCQRCDLACPDQRFLDEHMERDHPPPIWKRIYRRIFGPLRRFIQRRKRISQVTRRRRER